MSAFNTPAVEEVWNERCRRCFVAEDQYWNDQSHEHEIVSWSKVWLKIGKLYGVGYPVQCDHNPSIKNKDENKLAK